MSRSSLPLILASQSPRRVELLAQIGIVPDQINPAHINETPLKNELPRQLVARLALEKGRAIAKKDTYTLSGDTVVVIGRRILGKPNNEGEARTFLELISGRTHNVIGGICLMTPAGQEIVRVVSTKVKVKRLSETEIASYLATKEWEGKAGGYGIQGNFSKYISYIQGSYSNIVGLCVHTTYKMLDGNGYFQDLHPA